MAETAAKLVDRVIPEVPVRQWVLSMPWRLRFLLASHPELCQLVRRSFLRAVFRFYRSLLEREGIAQGSQLSGALPLRGRVLGQSDGCAKGPSPSKSRAARKREDG